MEGFDKMLLLPTICYFAHYIIEFLKIVSFWVITKLDCIVNGMSSHSIYFIWRWFFSVLFTYTFLQEESLKGSCEVQKWVTHPAIHSSRGQVCFPLGISWAFQGLPLSFSVLFLGRRQREWGWCFHNQRSKTTEMWIRVDESRPWNVPEVNVSTTIE